LIDCYSD